MPIHLEVCSHPRSSVLMSILEYETKSHRHDIVSADQIDEAAQLTLGREVAPEEALRVRRKIDKHIIPIMCGEYYRSMSLGSPTN